MAQGTVCGSGNYAWAQQALMYSSTWTQGILQYSEACSQGALCMIVPIEVLSTQVLGESSAAPRDYNTRSAAKFSFNSVPSVRIDFGERECKFLQ